MIIRFGPAGLGPVKDAIENLRIYSKLGLKACEIAFTYGVYIKNKEDVDAIRNAAKHFGIRLSIHAPYWINLNSKEKIKIEQSKKRILDCCETAEYLGAEIVVFHAGYYSDMDKEESYQNIKREILEILHEIKKNKWKVKIAPETTGKNSVFGSIEDIARLAEETKCSFCIDFAHILAREKEINWERINESFGKYDKWHCHYSGIEYGDKGEKHHKITTKEDWKRVLDNIPKHKDITIINESPSPVEDSVLGLRLV
ncbi:MAG: TIM barrel protein [Candidatus Pacearchaeota archaeon]